MADLSQPNNPFVNRADDHLSRLLVSEVEEPWYHSFLQNIKEFINPPKLPPLVLTSKPVAVKDIWGLYGRQKKSFMMSTGFQMCVVGVVFALSFVKPVQQAAKNAVTLIMPLDIDPYQPKLAPKKNVMSGGGGGGDRSPLPAAKGQRPQFALRQFTPPQQVIANPDAKLTMTPTLIGPPELNAALPNNNMNQWGDPLAKLGPASNGPGSGGGIGSGKGGGIGSGNGAGLGPGEGGGVGGNVFKVGGGVSAPILLHKVEPEYSEEARKAKYQGTVLLYIEVSPDGKATNIRVARSLGLGLDEKAIEAVKQWKFKPGYKNGTPVTVAATIEVNFRLL
ncbi:MAG TPA: energy transducer TonB [Bryobacteraceae bacterium]|nr:energy transducer TonB [Bryobacteraceae bacterium]